VSIKSSKKDQKGKVIFHRPVFELVTVAPETAAAGLELDKQLQLYLKEYLSRTRVEAARPPEAIVERPQPDAPTDGSGHKDDGQDWVPQTDDADNADVPF
jgi:hypothetical protein